MLTLKMKIILTAMFVTIIAFTVAGNAIAGLPSAEELAEKIGFSAADRKRILDGELVSTTFDPTNERELAVGIAFHVRLSVDELRKEMDQQLLPMTKDSNIIAWLRSWETAVWMTLKRSVWLRMQKSVQKFI